ncbi:MAG: tRNA (N(6)-L-threonylcarbamoyladenosine(37)-C(2))-methylthiotransferase MtaB [Peptococcaceae bacterium]|jgi:threonylcarbamoyladenosine tRNA methylthiotransferase MtaB|nr:tRNA (N(6)-L-threonylcarbamoyladenosine(37)-C(2))-methylthiotransferase MtaB [Peptococcaceae bacterium]
MAERKIVGFHTLGCKVNQSETEAMTALFLDKGYQLGEFEAYCDVYVINTCTVTHAGDRKSRQMIRRAKQINPQAIVVVTGCYAQTSPEAIAAIEDVDIILGTNMRHLIVDEVEAFAGSRVQLVDAKDTLTDFEEISMDRVIQKARAYLKVQEGCEQFCTYCIIPYARGPLRSRSMENTLQEAKKLEQAGFKEIILTGIHLGAYGKPSEAEREAGAVQQVTLADLCEMLLNETSFERIRLSSIEPTEVDDHLLRLFAENRRMCRHLHLPLQAGDDDVLEAMHRPYNTEQYRQEMARIREAVPDIALSTDLMVGFPGETDEQFENSLRFCDEIAFSSMHLFKYSPRQGTPAAGYPNQVPNEVKDIRSKRMQEMAERNMLRYMEAHLGQIVEVLVEEQRSDGIWLGHTDTYLHVAVDGPCRKNTMVKVLLDKIDGKLIKGKFIE